MSSNSSSDPSAASGNDSSNLQSYVALAVSLVALIVATFQLLQQYYGSTNGLTSCSKVVIGKWSKFTRRSFLWKEFRFEVHFATPVLFVAPPSNKYGPIADHDVQEIIYLDGTNYGRTHTWTFEEYEIISNARRTGRVTVHTADNELSSWVTMLMALQRMELESHQWQALTNKYSMPQTGLEPPPGFGTSDWHGTMTLHHHTLTVGMQEKRRTWDAMPSDLKKPYATSAMCHLVEMMAMLGIHWKEFNRSTNSYRAQGNGFIVTGSMVPNLGIAFTFETTSRTWFLDNRIVPENKVKQLCFGYCPTLFSLGLNIYGDERKDYGILQLGTKAEIAETLVAFSCNTSTVNYFRFGNDHTRYSHLFPVPFEMLGMVGTVFQIRSTLFTMLPNPTFYTWDKSAFSLVKMLDAFRTKLANSLADNHTDVLKSIKESPRIRRILYDAHISVIAAEKMASDDNYYDAILMTKQYRDKRSLAEQQRENKPVQLIPKSKSRTSWASKLMSVLSKAFTFIAWFFQPFLFFMRPIVLLGVFFGTEFYKLLIQVGIIEDAAAKSQRGSDHMFVDRDLAARPMKQVLIETLHDSIARCDSFLLQNGDHAEYVFALHMEELMCYLNSPYDDGDAEISSDSRSDTTNASDTAVEEDRTEKQKTTQTKKGKKNHRGKKGAPPPNDKSYYTDDYVPLHSIDIGSWATRDELLMDVYTKFIRKRVLTTPIPQRLKMYSDRTPSTTTGTPGASGAAGRPANTPPLSRNNTPSFSDEASQESVNEFKKRLNRDSQNAREAIADHHKKRLEELQQKEKQKANTGSKTSNPDALKDSYDLELAEDAEYISMTMLDPNGLTPSRSSSPARGVSSVSRQPTYTLGSSAGPSRPTPAQPIPAQTSTIPNEHVQRRDTGLSDALGDDEDAGTAAMPHGGSRTRTVSRVAGAYRRRSHPPLAAGGEIPSQAQDTNPEKYRPTTQQDMHDIWCTLVLRMMLWLMLHDFHEMDVQISKGDVYGMRQPVYIL